MIRLPFELRGRPRHTGCRTGARRGRTGRSRPFHDWWARSGTSRLRRGGCRTLPGCRLGRAADACHKARTAPPLRGGVGRGRLNCYVTKRQVAVQIPPGKPTDSRSFADLRHFPPPATGGDNCNCFRHRVYLLRLTLLTRHIPHCDHIIAVAMVRPLVFLAHLLHASAARKNPPGCSRTHPKCSRTHPAYCLAPRRHLPVGTECRHCLRSMQGCLPVCRNQRGCQLPARQKGRCPPAWLRRHAPSLAPGD